MTFADMLQPSFIRIRHRAVLLYDVVLIIGGSLFVGLSALQSSPHHWADLDCALCGGTSGEPASG